MLHLHFSNRFEILADRLLDALQGPRANVFTPDTVVVPHSAAERYIALAMADREGICANVEFVYLARWLWRQVALVLPAVGAESPFDSASLTWRLHAIFGDESFVGSHRPLDDYLKSGGKDPLLAYELAASAASLLEQLVTLRPDWLVRWQRGERGVAGDAALHESWQAQAWTRIARDLGLTAAHPMEEMARVLAKEGPGAAQRYSLPAQVHIFALPAIPPLYLTAVQSLARFMDVHLYALNPSREYWFDLVDPRGLDRLEQAGHADGFEVKHRLLTSWGGQSQSALALLAGIADAGDSQSHEAFEPSGRSTLLGRLQDSILDLEDFVPGDAVRAPDDRSIEVHVAHSLTRELEVLHDHLLGRFVADPKLRPSDIVVVTPDLEAAAPLVDAVFGTAPQPRRIPYALTGRRRTGVNAPVKAFVELWALAASRCTATGVMSLLQQPIVRRRFGLDDDDLQQVHDWMAQSGFHWGMDRAHVVEHGLPALTAHTLADGLSRLFLGYALPDGASEPFGGELACGEAEGSRAAALGALWDFATALKDFAQMLSRPRAPMGWARELHRAVERFLLPQGAEVEDALELHAAINALDGAMARAGFGEPVSAAVMRAALERELDASPHGGSPTGRVTFTNMAGLRNLPFRFVCAIGMNEGAYPTSDRPPEFDLIAAAPRLGDRQRRADQRTLFLDLLLSAREALYVSYTGRSVRDNAVLMPSVLVSELLDELGPAGKEVTVEHPLQPFSPSAFEDGGDARARSFDAELAHALRHGLDPRPAEPFFGRPLDAPDEEWRVVPLLRLVEFFMNPSRYLLRRRLQVELPGEAATLADDEPFLPDFEGRARLADRLLPHLLKGDPLDEVRRLALAGNELPAGAMGAGELENELASMARFARAVRQACEAPVVHAQGGTLDFDVEGEAWQLAYAFADLRADGLARWRYDDERATDVLRGWIHHLALCAAPAEGAAARTTWIARDGVSHYAPVTREQAVRRLASLVGLYRLGLSLPLNFFPKTSWHLVNADRRAAHAAWEGGDWGGESAKPGYALALRGLGEVLGEEFERHAGTVFGDIPVTRVTLTQFLASEATA